MHKNETQVIRVFKKLRKIKKTNIKGSGKYQRTITDVQRSGIKH